MTRLLLLLALLWSVPAAAHLTPNSELRLDFGRDHVAAELVVPLGDLGYAIGRPLGPADRPMLHRYVMQRIAMTAPDGRRWRMRLLSLDVTHDVAPDMVARLDLMPPPGAPLRRFDLAYRLVVDRVPDHFVMVLARNDFAGAHLSDRPEMLGGIQSAARTLRIDRGEGSSWRGFVSATGLGMHHIAEGHDHLLFLVALLLPAPLVAGAARWGGYGGLRLTVRRLVAVVTAFTVGHSLTLIGGAFLGWQLPARPVEIGIALSILVSAVHALRPIFAGREGLVAGGFGLVHGMAFATLIGRFGLDPWQKAQSILGFNIGIELVQLAVVAAVMPALILLAQTPAYRPFRIAGGWLTAAAAAAWLVERVSDTENAAGRTIDRALGEAPWLLALLTIVAALLFWRQRARAPIAIAP